MAQRAPYLGPARRREPILEAAADVFAEGGFEAASMAAVARAAGVAKPVLYDCFPGGKQELYFAILDRGERAFVEHLESVLGSARGQSLGEALRTGILGLLDYARLNPAAFRLIFGPSGSRHPEIIRRTERVREGVIRRITGRVVEHLGFDEATRDAAEVYVRGVVAVSEELARWTARRPELPREALVDLVVLWFMRGFDGVFAGDAPPE